ncbi:glycosyltransferase family 2 protein [Tautonia plasticadhaerens]|uniref:GalNAc(5)-diNAcBac-PP-undecaprenol beta-1,3-glucosyltransferase n=1 Tax=Tautonia plasticadhaerens TaxID=2527974 RepID=A0A518H607_9BACT|nr:glycosyltransferase [Tautonia plasticadhaerens]QDV36274.1 GalNAc(5)-diNAcBac-PP-undecaprenol beta-1,3-glucosyltransferase [Tautonia plasticadhaerens]
MLASVVVPTYHRPELLGRCLDALATQDLDPKIFEVLVVDDAASPETRRQVEAVAAAARPAIRYLAVTGRHGPAAARNAGWRAARGEVLAFTDDDCIPVRGWLAAGLSAIEGGASAACGRVVMPLPDVPTDYQRNAAGLASAEFVTANCFCRRDALESVGGLDERFSAAWREDSDLHFALLRAGLSIVRAPDAIVVHPVRPAPWGISLRQQRKTLFDALLYRKFPDLYRRRIRPVPPWDYYAIAASIGLGAVAAGLGHPRVALAAAALWALLTGRFCARRLRGNSLELRHVAEMIITSALIPPLSVFWRLYGSWKFRVLFL